MKYSISSSPQTLHTLTIPFGLSQVGSTTFSSQSCPNGSRNSITSPSSLHTEHTKPTFWGSVHVASITVSTHVCWPGLPVSLTSPKAWQTLQTCPTFGASSHFVATGNSSQSCFPVAGITTSSVAPHNEQVWEPFPSLAHVASTDATTSPHLCPAGIGLYPNAVSHNAHAYFPTPWTEHVASFNVETNLSTWTEGSFSVPFVSTLFPQFLHTSNL